MQFAPSLLVRLTFVALALVVGAGLIRPASVAAAIDVTGNWDVDVTTSEGTVNQRWELIQTGTTITGTVDTLSSLSGTIDPDTGDFDVTGGTCFGPPGFTFSGTVAPDANSFTATGTVRRPFGAFTCVTLAATASGTRLPCGDGVVDPGEQCDDGNLFAQDCCEFGCTVPPDGRFCDDGSSATAYSVCVAGTCVGADAPEFQVNNSTAGEQGAPAIACDATGGFVVAWEDRVYSFADEVLMRRYTSSGAAVGTEFQIATGTGSGDAGPAVAASATGDFIVAWTGNRTTPFMVNAVLGRRFSSNGVALGSEFTVSSSDQVSLSEADVAAATSGSIIVWTGCPLSGDCDVFGRRYNSAGAALGPQFRVNTATAYHQGSPAVAADAAGNFVVAWLGSAILAQRFAASGAFLGTEFQVNTPSTGFSVSPDVAAAANGDFVVVWYNDYPAAGDGIFARRYSSAGAALGTEFRVSAATTLNQIDPAVAVDAAAGFVVTWVSEDDGLGSGVRAARFDSAAVPIGTEFQVNGFTYNDQGYPAVCAAGSDEFVITWESDEQDGSSSGIFARRFGLPALLDHYKCYQGKDLKDPAFEPAMVDVIDQFGSESLAVQKVKFVCTPVSKNGEGIHDTNAHLTCYQVKGATLAPTVSVEVSSQFQVSRVELKKPKLLCLPSTTQLLP